MTKKSTRNLILGVVGLLLTAVLIQFVYFAVARVSKVNNHSKLMTFIDNDITYEEAELDDQLALLEEWADKKQLSDEDRGRVYERISLVYSNKGDTVNYYRYLGYALYYLENSGAIDYTVNIYLDLASFYIGSYSYTRASEIMDHVYELTPLNEIEDLQVRSYAYRVEAILEDYDGDYTAAEDSLQKSLVTINQSHTGIYEDAYRAMIAAIQARVYLHEERDEEAWEILEDYEDSELFTQTVYADVLVRDFVLPYYQTKSYLAVEFLPDSETKYVIEDFVAYCEDYNYPQMELNTLITLLDEYPPSDENTKEEFYALLNRAYVSVSDMSSDSYTSLIDGQITDAQQSMQDQIKEDSKHAKRIQSYLAVFILILLLIFIILMVIRSGKQDGLTGVLTRRVFNHDLALMKKSGNEYAIVMIDIDNFKHVNDTYGHPTGDQVLIELGRMMRLHKNSASAPFRYGGEEFTFLITKGGMDHAALIAENVRASMEKMQWDFHEKVTISVGVAAGAGSEDVLAKADERLYKAKQNGKNQVVSS